MARTRTARSQKALSQQLVRQENIRRALALKQQGFTYAVIAQQLEVSERTAGEYVREAIKQIPRTEAEDYREMQLARLEHMFAVNWGVATSIPAAGEEDDFDYGKRDAAQSRCQQLMRDINNLRGLEAPKEVHVTQDLGVLVIDGAKDEYIRQMQGMIGTSDPALTTYRELVESTSTLSAPNADDPSPLLGEVIDAEVVDE